MIHLSIITATYKRGRFIASMLGMVARQRVPGVAIEHIVVADGHDAFTEKLCGYHGAKYLHTEKRANDWGATPRDLGQSVAKGKYFCYWDDDVWIENHAVATVISTAWGADVGLCAVRHYTTGGDVQLPTAKGPWPMGSIDTMCFSVRRELALERSFAGQANKYAADNLFINGIWANHPGLVVAYSPVEIGSHIPANHG